jgi:hypothetical protein
MKRLSFHEQHVAFPQRGRECCRSFHDIWQGLERHFTGQMTVYVSFAGRGWSAPTASRTLAKPSARRRAASSRLMLPTSAGPWNTSAE